MGEMADDLIDGTFDHITGEYLGEGWGFPRTRVGKNKKRSFSKNKLRAADPQATKVIKDIVTFNRIPEKWYIVTFKFLNLISSNDAKAIQKICEEIMRKDLEHFKTFCKNYGKTNNT